MDGAEPSLAMGAEAGARSSGVRPLRHSHELVPDLVAKDKNVESAGFAAVRSARFVRDWKRHSGAGPDDSGVSFALTPINRIKTLRDVPRVVAHPAAVRRPSHAVGGVVQQLIVAGSSSRTRRLVSGTEGGTVSTHGATRTREDVRDSAVGGSRPSRVPAARGVKTSDEIRGTIGVTFIASIAEIPAVPGGLRAAAARFVCDAPDTGRVLTATRASA